MAKRKQELVLLDTMCEIPYECYLDFCEDVCRISYYREDEYVQIKI